VIRVLIIIGNTQTIGTIDKAYFQEAHA
jgi:hypothetical protein